MKKHANFATQDNGPSIAVIGGGHAGVEAALAASRLGVSTFLWTMNLDHIANLPCNPSIGGSAKGHLVREIDALGGEMGKAADATFLQSRMLGKSKGAAVHSLRVQTDRRKYSEEMKARLEKQENLYIIQGEIVEIDRKCETVGSYVQKGMWEITTNLGEKFLYDAVILATGTYLGGRVIVGDMAFDSGPDGSLAASKLTESIRNLGFNMLRFKTGTPPRIHKRSIDFSKLDIQHGDEEITPFSFETEGLSENKIDCYIAYTNERTHDIIRENLHKSPLYSGMIEGTGPRYCPSIEDKVVRFADKSRHQLFLEPMGLSTDEFYVQGFSTSLPPDVQREMIRSIEGLENAEIMRYAYAIEYDVVDPLELSQTLEYKNKARLFGAGQINGTSGYEEAAAQGLIAGINAAHAVLGKEQIILGRDEAYIGVLVDDLVTKGTNEPYRMMTARAEFRLNLRQDNADGRLTPIGYRIGLIGQDRYDRFLAKRERIRGEVESVKKKKLLPGDVSTEAQIELQYEGYIARQESQIRQMRKMERKVIPDDIDYNAISGLRIEARQKLDAVRPRTVGQAARISGVNPADVAVLLVWLK